MTEPCGVELVKMNQDGREVHVTVASDLERPWAPKEAAMIQEELRHAEDADRNFTTWHRRARRSQLEPMRDVAVTINRH